MLLERARGVRRVAAVGTTDQHLRLQDAIRRSEGSGNTGFDQCGRTRAVAKPKCSPSIVMRRPPLRGQSCVELPAVRDTQTSTVNSSKLSPAQQGLTVGHASRDASEHGPVIVEQAQAARERTALAHRNLKPISTQKLRNANEELRPRSGDLSIEADARRQAARELRLLLAHCVLHIGAKAAADLHLSIQT